MTAATWREILGCLAELYPKEVYLSERLYKAKEDGVITVQEHQYYNSGESILADRGRA